MTRSNIKYFLPLFIILLILLACTCSGTTPTISSTKQLDSTNGTVLSDSPIKDLKLNMSMIELFNYVDNLTQLQRPDFLKSIDGKTVDWTGLVDDVQSDGSVLIHAPSGRCFVNLSKVSMEVAKTVKKGANINFTGTLVEPNYDDYVGLCILLINVNIKSK
ncbi:MAG: hypothetical protein A2V66_17535 [Ignavibacteria bacterium RBG_13_36_8]|nr:MAG: hypothetical protein A2V66_17535 [Ignavibacteria bacterium RBG_13_36_8]